MPDKITIKLTSSEWTLLTQIVNVMKQRTAGITDKYERAIFLTLLRDVFVKLNARLPVLKAKNNLILPAAHAAVLAQSLQGIDTVNVLVIDIIRIIDQKLT